MYWHRAHFLLVAAVMFSVSTGAATPGTNTEETIIKDAGGRIVGRAKLTETPQGIILHVDFAGMAPGIHAFHIHQVGKCDPPFDSAGGHFNPTGSKHGFGATQGNHLGDLPNLNVPASGELTVEFFLPSVRLRGGPNALFDADGSALVIHTAADDYVTDPAGGAGNRIACGVLRPLEPVSVEGLEVAPP